ncbi:Rieske (2Fe-2S) protein [Marinimicrobium sp. ARAG 43.8]|uniref:Rieske (2Fe-2S) protein n=1 Tax=Marinimicrobium sp. ARAG 43.8 TaxID=3418719 RepID=UPI003CEB0700
MAYQVLETLHQLHDGYRRVFRVAGMELLLIQEEGGTFLLRNRCPHMAAPLHRSTVFGGIIRCPTHGIEFDLRSGQALNAPGGCAPLERIPIAYEGNTLGVDLGGAV